VRNCRFDGNALHREQLEIVAMLGPMYAINTCLDAERRLAFINFGEIIASHMDAVTFMKQYAETAVPHRYRCVITSSAGYPLDKTFYQTTKGIVGALDILEPGGSLLIASECEEGIGSPEFVEAQKFLHDHGAEAFLKEARTRKIANVDEWVTVKLIDALQRGRIHIYSSGLKPEERPLTSLTCHTDWQEAIEAVIKESGADEVALIPEGPYVIPHVAR